MSLLAPQSAVGMASPSKPDACGRPPPTPLVVGLPVTKWPQRVAVVAYGRYADYGQNNLITEDGTPKNVAHWACTNRVRIPTYHLCHALLLRRASLSLHSTDPNNADAGSLLGLAGVVRRR